MCGIAGFVGPWDRERLAAMTDALAHRGPDDRGLEHRAAAADQRLGLGHRRLSIIDLAGGHQPMWSGDGRRVVVFNGEIYNYRELRRELVALGHRFRTSSDTEVLLEGQARWGERLVERLEGMFAFALWDETDRSLLLARDRFGIKPLYLAEPRPGTLAFASEARSLLGLVGGARVHFEALYHHLLYGFGPVDATVFAGVRQLEPAHLARFAQGRLDRRRYWRPRAVPLPASPAGQAEALRASLDAAVRSHLVADVPVGITLSGGLDSSSVLALMAQAVEPGRIECFTLGWGRADDETSWARIAAGHVGVAAVERLAEPAAVEAAFDRMLWHLEEPLVHPVVPTTWFLARAVRERLKVVLIGEGSDELFGGYPHYRLFGLPWRLAPSGPWRRSFLAVAYLMPEASTVARLLHPDWLDRDLLEAVGRRYEPHLAGRPDPDRALLFEVEHELVSSQLARIDKLMMAHGVEARVPFLDRAFAETALAVPFRHKRRRGVEKAILRDAMSPLLPEAIVARPKSGRLGTQAILPALLSGALRRRVDEALDPRTLHRRGLFRPDAVARYLSPGPLARRHPVESRRRAKWLLTLTVLDGWFRLFVDGDGAAAPATEP